MSRRLDDDPVVTLVTRVLRDAPLPPAAAPRPPWLAMLVPTAVAALVALAFFAGRATVPREESAVAKTIPVVTEERRLREVSRALFALDPLDPVVQLRRQSELGLVQAALGGEHPCERRSTGCDW